MRGLMHLKAALVGLAAAAAYGLTLNLLISRISDHDMRAPAVLALVILGPMAASALAVLVASPKGGARYPENAFMGATVVTVLIVAAGVALREGVICLVMAAPLLYACGVVGALAAGALLRLRRGRAYSAAFLALPLLSLPAESRIDYPVRAEEVSTETVIDAPPETVWRHAIEIRDVRPQELHWTFTQDALGVPKPEDARLVGAGVGAERQARWARNVRFEEVVTDWKPARRLEWSFRFDRGDVANVVDHHIRLDRNYLQLAGGEYDLSPLPGRRTRLRLTTRYRLRIAGADYWAFWGRVFLEDVQGNVLGVVKARSERG